MPDATAREPSLAETRAEIRRAALDRVGRDFPAYGAAIERTLLENA